MFGPCWKLKESEECQNDFWPGHRILDSYKTFFSFLFLINLKAFCNNHEATKGRKDRGKIHIKKIKHTVFPSYIHKLFCYTPSGTLKTLAENRYFDDSDPQLRAYTVQIRNQETRKAGIS